MLLLSVRALAAIVKPLEVKLPRYASRGFGVLRAAPGAVIIVSRAQLLYELGVTCCTHVDAQ